MYLHTIHINSKKVIAFFCVGDKIKSIIMEVKHNGLQDHR